jgi:hypothetical protein
VTNGLQGRARGRWDVAVPGGALNGVQQPVAGAPTLTAGQDYVFLWTSKTGLTQVIGLSQGLFNVTTNAQGQLMVSRGATSETDAEFFRAGVTDSNMQMPLAQLVSRFRPCWPEAADNEKRWVAGGAGGGCFLLANTGSAYYYYTYFNSTAAPYTPIVARFDLNTLQQYGSVLCFQRRSVHRMYPGDSVCRPSSARLTPPPMSGTASAHPAYGWPMEAFTVREPRNRRPGIQIEFSDDIPPGLLALSYSHGGWQSHQGPERQLPAGYLSLMELPSTCPAYFNGPPSYSEEFFVTLVHEFGHTWACSTRWRRA